LVIFGMSVTPVSAPCQQMSESQGKNQLDRCAGK
jgi:hypothetical protein